MCRSIWRKELKNLSCSILGLYKGNIMTRKEIIHLGLCLIRLIYRKAPGARFSKDPETFRARRQILKSKPVE